MFPEVGPVFQFMVCNTYGFFCFTGILIGLIVGAYLTRGSK